MSRIHEIYLDEAECDDEVVIHPGNYEIKTNKEKKLPLSCGNSFFFWSNKRYQLI